MAYVDAAVDGDNLQLGDSNSATAYTSSGVVQNGGSDGEIDFTADFKDNPAVTANLEYTAIDTADADETYALVIEQAASNAFTTITDSDTIAISTSETRAYGPITIRNRFVRASLVLGGTSPSITLEKVWIGPQKQ